MAGRVHHLTASATGGAASEPNLLDLCRQLWVPQDFAGVEAAIGELISNLFPGIRARLTRAGYEELSRTQLTEPVYKFGGHKLAWAPAAFANRCVYVANQKELICVSLAAAKTN